MRQQELKDQLLKQLESHWQGFRMELEKAKLHLKAKVDELVKLYGPEIVGVLLKRDRINITIERIDSPASAPTKPVKTKKVALVKTAPKKKARRHRKMHFSKEGLASRKLQAVYLNLLNKMPKGDKAKYKKLAKAKNRQVAINAMRSFLNK